MTVVIGNDWYEMFNDPGFRQGWTEHRLGVAPDYRKLDTDLLYEYGRQMAAESGMPLPAVSDHLTPEMAEAARRCTAFIEMMVFKVYKEKRRIVNL